MCSRVTVSDRRCCEAAAALTASPPRGVQEMLDSPQELIARLDPKAGDVAGTWEPFLPQCRVLHGIAQRCLEPIKRRRAEIRDLVAELETGDPAPQPNTDMTPDLEAQPQPIHPI